MTSRLRIVVTGLIAQHPALGGVAWDYLQYPLGLARLGHDVYYVEDSGEWPYTLNGGPAQEDWIARDPTPNVRHLASVMERFGLGDRWAYKFPIGPRWYGLSHAKRREVIASADLLLNVSGTLKRPSDYRQIPRLAYIDSDPVFTQVKLGMPRGQLKFQRRVAAHDVHFSFGEQLGSAPVPPTRFQWLPTRQPIILDQGRASERNKGAYTTVMSWTSYRPLRLHGVSYGQKDAEFARFADLPNRVKSASFRVALGGTRHGRWRGEGWEGEPESVLRSLGWTVVDPLRACAGLDRYREFIESSRGEWSVAKNGYVVGQSGWFSCRSACYLAAGRPVIVQDTGFKGILPSGEGLVAFSTLDEAVAGIEDVESRYRQHARAARELAETYFDSSTVLASLLEDAMSSTVQVRGAAA